ncbi:penicillin-binding protein 2 [Sansalvadorimonas sp. 2012CJ34-2]|uniref:Peptidoglycan D,D-transpeptidase MrdA n=1 Tax=Parendozoicomonas callyspongiae TaxID=2942213 RepID=A0ABT0PCU1_9GAMM|nr:penicillin-binding protein 2 [Sansalvadorimonas sp. 2012CJ34-2]MCL6269123.1 penicillin-binding protein 2 [Sansalvadorimonas sp. 2012CJ34-2]
MAADTFKDHPGERRLVNFRVWLAVAVMILMTAGLIARAFYLQVVQYDDLATQSEDNRIHLRTVPPVRGLIYDTKGRLLADNQPSYNLTIIRERVEDLDKTLDELGKIIELDPEDVKDFRERVYQTRPFNSVPLKYRLTEEEIAQVSVNQHRLPGVNVEAQLIRSYPLKSLLAHAVGYVGRINDRELKKIDPSQYSGTNIIGKTGVERFYEDILLGKPGYQEVESNARGRVLRVLKQVNPIPGQDINLYLDLDLQKVAMEALKGKRGAVVAMDPNTGGILALASAPSYDTNPFVSGISYKAYSELRDDINRPLYNRATLGEYPPASTIKPFMALAALDSGTIERDYRIFDKGYYQLPGEERKYRNWKRKGDGWTDLVRSIARSNDTYYYDIAVKMGIDTMHDYLILFGFGEKTGLDIASERSGLVPSRAWKKRARGAPWYPGETVIAGIGQGYLLTTPLQLAMATSIIANRGTVVQPRLAKPGPGVAPIPPLARVEKDQKDWETVIDGMRSVIEHPRGTAYIRMGKNLQYTVAGKTGTAQVVGLPQDIKEEEALVLEEFQKDHGLFVAFAPIENPQIALGIIVENDSKAAVKIARKVLDAYLLPRLAEQKVLGGLAGNALQGGQ